MNGAEEKKKAIMKVNTKREILCSFLLQVPGRVGVTSFAARVCRFCSESQARSLTSLKSLKSRCRSG